MVFNEDFYLATFLQPLNACKLYKPRFGQGNSTEGLSLQQFLELYGADPFYAWIGLNTELMYTSHRIAGAMTSIYRQLGIGCENLFRQIIIDSTQYSDASFATWSYTTVTSSGKQKTLSLDGRNF